MPASTLTPGTDIKSVTKPAALLELSHLLQGDELAISEENRPNNVSITYDADALLVTISATIPIAFTLDTNGKPVATAGDYLAPLT
jgi:hypothetical protein